MPTVDIAQEHNPRETSSTGRARNMLLRQVSFPLHFDDNEHLASIDHDTIADLPHFKAAVRKWVKPDRSLSWFFQNAQQTDVKALIVAALKPYQDTVRQWNGFRVMVTINRGTGQPVYTLQLFNKRRKSHTVLFTGEHAPNVQGAVFEGEERFERVAPDWRREAGLMAAVAAR